jgi:hypothetical protein
MSREVALLHAHAAGGRQLALRRAGRKEAALIRAWA